MVNATKLTKELRDFGIPVIGADSNGTVWFESRATSDDRALAAEIVREHDPSPTVQEKLARIPVNVLELAFAISVLGMPTTSAKAVAWAHDVVKAASAKVESVFEGE